MSIFVGQASLKIEFSIVRTAILGFLLSASVACSNEFSDVSDSDLADGVYACRTETDQSPGMAIRCDNYQRECQRRRDDGRYVC